MTFQQLSPVILVEAIEPCLSFWIDRLGFIKTAEVPHEDQLGFVMLERDSVAVMYQSFASAESDVPAVVDRTAKSNTALFIKLTGLDDLKPALEGAEIVVPERTTFYGMREIFLRAPCGTVVGLAEDQ